MECRDLREKLSAYVDEQLPPDDKKAVRQHLDRCPRCNTHLEELRKGIEYVRELEGVEPPPWFVRKVMSKVLEEAGRNRGILRKLFYPLHIKIPLEAAATVVIVVTAFYVLRAVQPHVTVERPVSRAELSSTADRSDRFPAQREEMVDETLPEPAKESEEVRRPFAGTEGKEGVGEEGFKAFPRKSEEPEAPVILPQEKKAPETTFRPLDMEASGKSGGVVHERAETSVQPKKREYAFTLRAGDIQNSLKTVKATIQKLHGVILKDEVPDDSIIIAEIEAGKISSFRKSLLELGSIEEETVEGVGRRVRVKVQFLQGHKRER